jgi:hypothetical protein
MGAWRIDDLDAMIQTMADSATGQGPPTGWEALRAAEWEQARAAFEAELAGKETARALDGRAQARWWLSDISGAIEAWEGAYTAYRRGGLDEPAAHVAVLLSREHAEALGNHGWRTAGWPWWNRSEPSTRCGRSLMPSGPSPWRGEPGTRTWSWPRWAGLGWAGRDCPGSDR